jgi:hypothetical protein
MHSLGHAIDKVAEAAERKPKTQGSQKIKEIALVYLEMIDQAFPQLPSLRTWPIGVKTVIDRFPQGAYERRKDIVCLPSPVANQVNLRHQSETLTP